MNYEEIERMKQENKEMRLELQKLKACREFNGSHYTGITGGNTHHKENLYENDDHSPLSYNPLTDDIEDNAARTPVTQKNYPPVIKYVAPTQDALNVTADNHDPDDSDDIEAQFQKYQT